MNSGLLVRRQALCLRLATLPGERTRARIITGRRILAIDAQIMASATEELTWDMYWRLECNAVRGAV